MTTAFAYGRFKRTDGNRPCRSRGRPWPKRPGQDRDSTSGASSYVMKCTNYSNRVLLDDGVMMGRVLSKPRADEWEDETMANVHVATQTYFLSSVVGCLISISAAPNFCLVEKPVERERQAERDRQRKGKGGGQRVTHPAYTLFVVT